MPHQFRLDHRPVGYALESAKAAGQRIKTVIRGFTTTEDGDRFVTRLEGLPSVLLAQLPAPGIRPSSVEYMLAVIHPDLLTDLYVNECEMVFMGRAVRAIPPGENVYEDDLVDIETLEFEGVKVPREAAVVCVLSAGWRKGLFFDLAPLFPNRQCRSYDIWRILGSCLAYLMNQQIFVLNESQWEALFQHGWFPFVSLPKRLIRQMIARAKDGSISDLPIGPVAGAVRDMAPRMRSRWQEGELLRPHLPLLVHALDRFLEGDYVSATSILYPRIEGILRSMHAASLSASSLKPAGLAQVAIDSWVDVVNEYSWLLPIKFKNYLMSVYFANFSPGQPALFSRHSVGHGVAQAEDFDQKHACIAILIVDQLRFLLPIDGAPTTS
jgi:hypothetical protein